MTAFFRVIQECCKVYSLTNRVISSNIGVSKVDCLYFMPSTNTFYNTTSSTTSPLFRLRSFLYLGVLKSSISLDSTLHVHQLAKTLIVALCDAVVAVYSEVFHQYTNKVTLQSFITFKVPWQVSVNKLTTGLFSRDC